MDAKLIKEIEFEIRKNLTNGICLSGANMNNFDNKVKASKTVLKGVINAFLDTQHDYLLRIEKSKDELLKLIKQAEVNTYHTSYEITELVYHLLYDNIAEVIVLGGCLYSSKTKDIDTLKKEYPDSENVKHPARVYYYNSKDVYSHYSESRDLTEKELADFKHLKENSGKYHTLTYEKDGQIGERKLYAR